MDTFIPNASAIGYMYWEKKEREQKYLNMRKMEIVHDGGNYTFPCQLFSSKHCFEQAYKIQ